MLALTTRTTLRASARQIQCASPTKARHASFLTPPAKRKSTFKGTLLRWGVVIGGIYWYNTSSLFAEVPETEWQQIAEMAEDNRELPTVDSLTAAQRARRNALATAGGPASEIPPPLDAPSSSTSPENSMIASRAVLDESQPSSGAQSGETQAIGGPQDLEEEAEQQGAFNEETGEINWDCPCLGGMAHGPCGPQFREAFSCFVYSKEEPKGIECIDRFKNMQDCFRAHPDVYAAELSDDPDEEAYETEAAAPGENTSKTARVRYNTEETIADKVPDANVTSSPSANPLNIGGDVAQDTQNKSGATKRAQAARNQVDTTLQDESEALVPKAAHDTTDKNKNSK